jgi:hypothetical protein
MELLHSLEFSGTKVTTVTALARLLKQEVLARAQPTLHALGANPYLGVFLRA